MKIKINEGKCYFLSLALLSENDDTLPCLDCSLAMARLNCFASIAFGMLKRPDVRKIGLTRFFEAGGAACSGAIAGLEIDGKRFVCDPA